MKPTNDFDPFALGGVQDDDAELFALIAEEARLRDIGCDYRGRADEIYFAISDGKERFRNIEEEDLPEPIGPLYRKAKEYEDASGELCDRIMEYQPATIAGAIALLNWSDQGVDPEIRDNVVAGLREIVMRGVQS
jgi:hypothetical protein